MLCHTPRNIDRKVGKLECNELIFTKLLPSPSVWHSDLTCFKFKRSKYKILEKKVLNDFL